MARGKTAHSRDHSGQILGVSRLSLGVISMICLARFLLVKRKSRAWKPALQVQPGNAGVEARSTHTSKRSQ